MSPARLAFPARTTVSTPYVVHACTPGSRPKRLDGVPDALPADDRTVLWIDVAVGTPAADVLQVLAPLAPSLDLDDVEDLMERDELPKTHDRAEDFRNASFVGFVLSPAPDGSHVGDLQVQMVETLVGQRLLVSCWQQSMVFRGLESVRNEAPVLCEAVGRDVLQTWRSGGCTSASDLVSALVQGLLMHSRRAVFDLERVLQVWEVGYHADSEKPDTDTLKRLLATVNEVRRRLTAFENARPLGAPQEDGVEAVRSAALERRVEALTSAGQQRCANLLDGIRGSMELVSMDRVARQGEVAAAQAQREKVFQGRLEKVTALLLVPTLIAGIFGANTALPGGGTWLGFDSMMILMVVASAAVYLFLVARRGGSGTS